MRVRPYQMHFREYPLYVLSAAASVLNSLVYHLRLETLFVLKRCVFALVLFILLFWFVKLLEKARSCTQTGTSCLSKLHPLTPPPIHDLFKLPGTLAMPLHFYKFRNRCIISISETKKKCSTSKIKVECQLWL